MGVLPSEFNRQSDRITRNKGRRRADSFFQVGTTNLTTSGATESIFATINLPSQPGPYLLHVFVLVILQQSAGTDQFDIKLHLDTGAGGAHYRVFRTAHTSSVSHSECFIDVSLVPTFSPHVLNVGIQRAGGAGTISTLFGGDPRANRVQAIITPF